MNWYECKQVKELKQLGSFQYVKAQSQKDLTDKINFTAKSWEELSSKINILSGLFQKSNTGEIWHDGFVSEADKYLFCLLNLDGKNRQKNLGVNGLHYRNKDIAKKWRKKIAQKIHPDKCSDTRASSAMMVLEDMYAEMVG